MKWIWIDDVEENQYADFVFDFKSDGGKSVIKVASCGEYVLFLNGEFVSCGQYNSYPEKKFYDKIIFNAIKGINRVAIIGYLPNKNTCNELKDGRGIAFSVESSGLKYESDENVLSRKSLVYKSGETFRITGNIGYSIHSDLSKNDNFVKNGIKLSGFQKSVVTDVSPIYHRPIKKLVLENKRGTVKNIGFFSYENFCDIALQMQNAYMSTRRFNLFSEETDFPYNINCKTEKNIFIVIDMLRETTGYLDIDIEVLQDTRIDYCWGEHLDDLRVRAEISGRRFAGSVILKKGRNKYTEYFCRLGLRYLTLFIHSNKFILHSVGLKECYYPNKKIEIKTDNYLEQKIYDVSVHTLECCMHEHYEDCAWREQSQYVMDSRNQILAGFYAFKNKEFVKASISLMFEKIYDDGNIPLMQPSDYILKIPDFSLVSIMVVKDYTEFTGDLSFARSLWEKMKFIITKFKERIDDNGLWRRSDKDNQWHFFEWTYKMSNAFGDNPLNEEDVQYALPSQAFLVAAFDAFVWIAKKIGRKDDVVGGLAQRIKKTAHALFFNEEKKLYGTYNTNGKTENHFSEFANVLAIYSGICPIKERKAIISRIINNDKELQKMSLSNYLYKYEVLLSYGERYKSFVREEIQRVWGEMLFNKATAFFEVEEGADAFYYAGSLCHGWSAIPAYIYGKYIFN